VRESRDAFFDHLEHKSGGGSLKWYRRTWVLVFQYVVVSFVVAVATDITQAAGVYCANGQSGRSAHIWVSDER